MTAGAPVASRRTMAAFDPADNAGRALYVLFAVAVVFSHAFVLGGFDETARYAWSNYSLSFGTLGVSGFFVLGGFLLAASVGRRPGAGRFLWTRSLRLLPLIWVSLLVTAFVIAPIGVWYRTGSVAGYPVTGDGGALSFVGSNAFVLLRQWSIGTTLDGTPFPVSWNGSLWTMASLFTGYLVLAGLLLLGLVRGRRWLAPAATAVFWLMTAAQSSSLMGVDLRGFDWVTESWQATLLGPDSTVLISLFFLGCATYLYRERLPTGPVAVLVALSALEASFVLHQWHLIGGPAWAYLTLILLIRLPWRLSAPLGVVSFGIYVWAFPVEQFGALLGLHEWGYVPYATICLVAACGAALASYHLVEQPTMRLRRYLLGRRPPQPQRQSQPEAQAHPEPQPQPQPVS